MYRINYVDDFGSATYFQGTQEQCTEFIANFKKRYEKGFLLAEAPTKAR